MSRILLSGTTSSRPSVAALLALGAAGAGAGATAGRGGQGLARGDRVLDVLAPDPPTDTGARDVGHIDVVLGGEPAHQWRQQPTARAVAGDGRGGRGDRGGDRGVGRPAAVAIARRSGVRRAGVPMRASTVPTGTVSPALTRMLSIFPSYGLGISESTLSVDTSKRGSSNATSSPTAFSQLPIVPSVTDSPSLGMVTSKTSPASDDGEKSAASVAGPSDPPTDGAEDR